MIFHSLLLPRRASLNGRAIGRGQQNEHNRNVANGADGAVGVASGQRGSKRFGFNSGSSIRRGLYDAHVQLHNIGLNLGDLAVL
jgi:hypothetical protein